MEQLSSGLPSTVRLAAERDRVNNMPEGPAKDKAMRSLVDAEVNSLSH